MFDAKTLHFVFINRVALENLGYPLEEMLKRTPLDLKKEFNKDSFNKLLAPLQSGKVKKLVFTTNHTRKDGSHYPVEVHLQLSTFDSKQTFSAIVLDITKRTEKEQELERVFQQLSNSEEQYRNMVEKSPVGIVLVEPNSGAIVDVNQALIDILGYSIDEFRKINANDLIPEHRKDELKDHLKKMEKQGKVTFETERIHKGGFLVSVEITLSMTMYGDALPVIMAVVNDISERKRAKERLLLGIMSAEDNERKRISSEIHDGLQQTLICSSLQFEQIKAENEEKNIKNESFNQGLDFLNKAINESRTIAHTLLPKTVEDCGLVASLNEIVSRINLLSQVEISLKCDIDGLMLETSIALRLFHIVQEAINNALKHAHASCINISITKVENKLVLSISDNGYGFDLNCQNTNTSFGLRTMKQKAKAISGEFIIESTPNHGTKIRIKVPLI